MSKSTKGKPAPHADPVIDVCVLSAQNIGGSNLLNWFFNVPAGMVIKWVQVCRRFTDTSGFTPSLNGGETIIIKTSINFYNSFQEVATVPFSDSSLLPGTYQYTIRGSYGVQGDSLSSIGYISNEVVVTV